MTKTRKKAMVLVLTFALTWGAALVAHASSTAVLLASEKEKSTGAVANVNGGFTWWRQVETISKYDVQFIMFGGTNSNNLNNVITSCVKAPGESFSIAFVKASTATNNVGKVTLFGNNQSNPQKDCIAGAGISSTN